MKTIMTNVGITGTPPDLIDRIMVGVILEKRDSRHAWQNHSWRAVGIIPGGGQDRAGRLLSEGPGWAQFYAGALELRLFPKETDGYRQNLLSGQPKVYVVLRPNDGQAGDTGQTMQPFLVTVCPHEAQDYLDSGEESVDCVPMPPETRLWLAQFVERHHVHEPFIKRQRNPKTGDGHGDPFWRKPPVTDRD